MYILNFNAYFVSSANRVLHIMSSVIVIGHICKNCMISYMYLFSKRLATEKSCVGKYPTLSWIVLIYNSLLDDTEDVISSTEESSALHRAGVACKVKLMAHYNMSQVMLVSLQLSLILVSLYRPCLY